MSDNTHLLFVLLTRECDERVTTRRFGTVEYFHQIVLHRLTIELVQIDQTIEQNYVLDDGRAQKLVLIHQIESDL